MKKFLITLILLMTISWEWVGIIPLDFMENNKEPKIRHFIIETWIENIKMIHPHCRKAYIRFEDTEDANIINIYAKCYKWEI